MVDEMIVFRSHHFFMAINMTAVITARKVITPPVEPLRAK